MENGELGNEDNRAEKPQLPKRIVKAFGSGVNRFFTETPFSPPPHDWSNYGRDAFTGFAHEGDIISPHVPPAIPHAEEEAVEPPQPVENGHQDQEPEEK